MKPFRWNLSQRAELGRLADGPATPAYPEVVDDLRECAARVLRFCRDSDLVFLGRSPDSVFDYLSGLLRDTSWQSRLSLLNVSVRHHSVAELRRDHRERLDAFHEHLAIVGLDAPDLVRRERPIALVDVVATGATFGHVVEIILAHADELGVDTNAVKRRIRFIGLTWRTHTSPKTIRWHQHAEWLTAFPKNAAKNVSIPGRLWDYIGNRQPKAALWNPPWRWGHPAMLEPLHDESHVQALSFALRIYDAATSADERDKAVRLLSTSPEMKYAWLRALVLELRRAPRSA